MAFTASLHLSALGLANIYAISRTFIRSWWPPSYYTKPSKVALGVFEYIMHSSTVVFMLFLRGCSRGRD
ncbi:hypothetical protein BKA63DRAFT_510453 [Paraphoma chrysanthemicola]|nr:hypothetical protein BKA63DRAFT_510453 [Paraphoma chrysanthemicola]